MPRVLHTADWHLGKRLHDFWLLDEQREALTRLLEVVDDERPDLVAVAGDLFDVPVPQVRALQLWEWAADEIVGRRGVPMVVIPGNHDHAERIAMNARMARRAGLYVLNDLAAAHRPVRVAGVDVFGVPFHKPPHVRALASRRDAEGRDLGDGSGRKTDVDADGETDADAAGQLGDFDYDAAMGWLLERARAERSGDAPSLLLAHAFVDGAGEEPDGEAAIVVGGAGGVRPGTLAGFDYVALGHLHGPRTLAAPAPVRYAGSLYPYAFGEPNEKSVTVVDLPARPGGAAPVRTVPLPVRRRVRLVTGRSFEEVILAGEAARAAQSADDERAREGGLDADDVPHPDDYLLVRVTDRDPIDHALSRLREVHPHALLEQPVVEVRSEARRLPGDARTLRVEDAFAAFYESVFGEAPNELEAEILRSVLAGDTADDEDTAGGREDAP